MMSDPPGIGLLDYVKDMLAEKDLRDEQRFQAQLRSSEAALAATREALTIALAAAEKSAAAALAANQVLAAKAEQFADQKLETHNQIKPWVQTLLDTEREARLALERRVSRFENREEGMTLTTKVLVGAIGLAATLIGIYFALHRG